MLRMLLMWLWCVGIAATGYGGEIIIDGKASEWLGKPAVTLSDYQAPTQKQINALTFSGPGTWSLSKATNLTGTQHIRVRLVATAPAQVLLQLASGQGFFAISFMVTKGEQAKVIPIGTFERKGIGVKWQAISGIKLTIPAGCSLQFLEIAAISESPILPREGLWLYQRITPITHIGTAWPLYAIIDKSTYPPRVEQAGKSLAKWLHKLYAIQLPLNAKEIAIKPAISNVILVGKKAVVLGGILKDAELKKQGFNGFVIKADNSSLAIAGDSVQGTNYGVYKFLQKQGLKFYAPGVFSKMPPKDNTLTLVEFRGKPFFEGKRFTGPFCIYGDSSARLSLGDPRTAGIDKEYPCDKTLWIDHTAAFLVPKKLYMKDHPEYYITKAGSGKLSLATPDVRLMVCQTNPGGIQVAVGRLLKWIKAQSERKYFVVQQGDDMEKCQCPTCRNKRDQESYNESDLMLHWVNAIARQAGKVYPDKIFLCYAYGDTQPAPNKLRPEANVHVLYCPWPNKSSAPNGFRDFDAPENIIAGSQIRAWGKVAGRNLGLYDYNSGIVLSLYGMADRIKWYARHGHHGSIWYCGTNKTFPQLFAYIHTQLNWDPFQDVSRLQRDFIRHYYGNAAEVMDAVISSIYSRLDDDRLSCGRIPSKHYFEKTFVTRILSLFDEALKKAPLKLTKEIRNDRKNFVLNGVYALKPVGQKSISQEEWDVFGILLKQYIAFWLEDHRIAVEKAKKQGKPVPGYDGLTSAIFRMTHVKIEANKQEVPPLVLAMQRDPVVTILKHRITDFTKKLADGKGLLIPAIAFSGGEGPMYYNWKCQGRVAAWVRGTMTEVSSMHATFKLETLPQNDSILEIDGLDSDKAWCPQTPIQIQMNGVELFNGPNGCAKDAWTTKSFAVPAAALRKGDNVLTVKNLANTDNRAAYWFMLSEARLIYKE